ncbi:MAG: DNA gyrase inhibitor YacG [Rhizobiales bacterium]|nr:DNA gyrase inhibitor YacG [Hyphomicrobiales bacterium]
MTDKDLTDDKKLAKTGRACVMCKKPAIVKFRPFCSIRCADLDLGKWLNGSYVVRDPVDNDENEFSSDQLKVHDALEH